MCGLDKVEDIGDFIDKAIINYCGTSFILLFPECLLSIFVKAQSLKSS